MFKAFILSLGCLTAILWMLVKLKDLRERPDEGMMPNDESTLMLGMFLTLTKGAVEYFKQRKRYPPLISGAPDGLEEMGFLKGDPIAEKSGILRTFSIVTTEAGGFGICLKNLPAPVANGIMERASASPMLRFKHFNGGDECFEDLLLPINKDTNLTLPLPFEPGGP